jgi:hypothetical protein
MMFHDSVSLMQIASVVMIVIGSLLWWRGLNGSSPLRPIGTAANAAGQ